MVELMVAMLIMFTALLVMAYTMYTGLSTVGFSRQRTEATALANQALEQIRALPARELYLSTADVAGDAQLVSCGTATCFNSRTVPTSSFASAPSNDPLDPHIQHTTGVPGNTPYTIKSYLSVDPTDASGHTMLATVQVSWTQSVVGGVASNLQVESKLYNSQFNEAAPSIHSFLANASSTPGSITVSASVLGSSLANVTLSLPSVSAGLGGTTIPNTTAVGTGTGVSPVTGSVAASNVTVASTQLLNSPAVSESALSAAGGTYNLSPAGSGTPTIAGSPSQLSVNLAQIQALASAGPATTAQAVAASSAAGQAGITNGTSPLPATSSGLGFGQAVASQSGLVGAQLNVLSLLGLNIGSIQLAELEPTGNNTTSTIDNATVAQSGSQSAPQNQTYNATASQSFGTLNLVQLPGLAPLVSLVGFQQTANACAAPTGMTCTQAPPTYSGSISLLGGTPITIATLLTDTQPVLQALSNLLTKSVVVGLLVGVTTSATISVTPTVTNTPGSETVPSLLTININLSASLLGGSLLNVSVGLNLGTVTASASYS